MRIPLMHCPLAALHAAALPRTIDRLSPPAVARFAHASAACMGNLCLAARTGTSIPLRLAITSAPMPQKGRMAVLLAVELVSLNAVTASTLRATTVLTKWTMKMRLTSGMEAMMTMRMTWVSTMTTKIPWAMTSQMTRSTSSRRAV
ncbi:hypothetical protein MPH_06644 [Macrophomina phaseolina MS6]|uniref:Uncharacterized protein n=1 Tax=Macrophomina phaseolina (strain MS6) TaxID=1126212 RepID=K2RU16_MACPH|nr:hypothetical protein MPH_06644 [Macrophomina phaseolina MS6]